MIARWSENAGECGGPGAAGISGLADEFLSVRAHDLFHGGEFPLHAIGTVGLRHHIGRTGGARDSRRILLPLDQSYLT